MTIQETAAAAKAKGMSYGEYVNETEGKKVTVHVPPDLPTAISILNRIRKRAGLSDLPASKTGSKEALWEAYKVERRKELVFEGFRMNDLTRWEEFETVMNNFVDNDPYARNTNRFTKVHYKFPIQNAVLSGNESLKQIEGY